MKCQKCGKEVFLPFECPYCKGYFCSEHHLPENHDCPRIELARAPKREIEQMNVQKKPYEYKITYSQRPSTKIFRFSQKELKHLTLGALLVMGVGLSFIPQILSLSVLTSGILLSLAIIFTVTFILHEIAHKLLAQRYGFWAEFRLTFLGALVTTLSMLPFAFFKIISPGAVMIAGAMTRKEAGKTALAGPLTNITLSTVFTALVIMGVPNTIRLIAVFGAWINAIIALFNLIPLGILDGLKVFRWDKAIWILAFTAGLILTIVSYIMIS